jgi:hypothetical protein
VQWAVLLVLFVSHGLQVGMREEEVVIGEAR